MALRLIGWLLLGLALGIAALGAGWLALNRIGG